MKKIKVIIFGLIFSLYVVSYVGQVNGNNKVVLPAPKRELLEGVSSIWFDTVKKNISKEEYMIYSSEDGKNFEALNRANSFKVIFAEKGIEVYSLQEEEEWKLGFELMAGKSGE